jgi:hypothetical protein
LFLQCFYNGAFCGEASQSPVSEIITLNGQGVTVDASSSHGAGHFADRHVTIGVPTEVPFVSLCPLAWLVVAVGEVRKAKSHSCHLFSVGARGQLHAACFGLNKLRLLKTKQVFCFCAGPASKRTENFMHWRVVPAGFREICAIARCGFASGLVQLGEKHRGNPKNTACSTLLPPVCRLRFFSLCALSWWGQCFEAQVARLRAISGAPFVWVVQMCDSHQAYCSPWHLLAAPS